MNTDLGLVILLQIAGVAVIIAEIFLPSGGLLSVIAAGFLGYSLFVVFNDVSTTTGLILVAADALLIPWLVIVCLKLFAKSPVTLRKELSKINGVTSQSPELETFLGKQGIAITDLRPSGIARINGQRVDVVSRGEYLEKGAKITVSSVKGNQIIVTLIENHSGDAS